MIELPSIIFRALMRPVYLMLNLAAIYLLFSGHNDPGGGFIAGLCTSLSLILVCISRELNTFAKMLRVDPVNIAVAGLLIALFTVCLPGMLGYTILEHLHADLYIPFLGKIHLNTALPFDIGVYLVVTGIGFKIIIGMRHSVLIPRPDEEAKNAD